MNVDIQQKKTLISLCNNIELFHTPSGEAFATVSVNDHHETWGIKSIGFKNWLKSQYYLITKSAPSNKFFDETLDVLAAKAIYGGSQKEVFLRVAKYDGKIFIDLSN